MVSGFEKKTAVAGHRDSRRDDVMPQGDGPPRRIDRQRDAEQRQAQQQAGRDRDHDEAGIKQTGGAEMDTAADEVKGPIEDVRPRHQNHAWADRDEAQRRTQIVADRQPADNTGEKCCAEWLYKVVSTHLSERAPHERARAGAREDKRHCDEMVDPIDDR